VMVSPVAVVPVKIIAFLQHLRFEAALFFFNYSMPSAALRRQFTIGPCGILRQVPFGGRTKPVTPYGGRSRECCANARGRCSQRTNHPATGMAASSLRIPASTVRDGIA